MRKYQMIKYGIWTDDDDIWGDEIKYHPLPEEKSLMDQIEYDLKHALIDM